jgi:hypothetical protein
MTNDHWEKCMDFSDVMLDEDLCPRCQVERLTKERDEARRERDEAVASATRDERAAVAAWLRGKVASARAAVGPSQLRQCDAAWLRLVELDADCIERGEHREVKS